MQKNLVFLFLVLNISAYSESYYVDSSATGTNDGSSWVNAYDRLHNCVWRPAYRRVPHHEEINGETVRFT